MIIGILAVALIVMIIWAGIEGSKSPPPDRLYEDLFDSNYLKDEDDD